MSGDDQAAPQAERVDDHPHERCHRLDAIVVLVSHTGQPMTGQVDGNDAPRAAQPRDPRRPALQRHGATVQQHQRVAGPPLVGREILVSRDGARGELQELRRRAAISGGENFRCDRRRLQHEQSAGRQQQCRAADG